MHIAQLAFQHNDIVEDKDDAYDKYTAHQLFRNLAAKGGLMSNPPGLDSGFRLFSEDLRPANVLLDKNLNIVGVIDWEFAYAAPAQFRCDPPWWLLLKEPENWKGGHREWMDVCEPRFQTSLRVMEIEEKKKIIASTDITKKVGALSLASGGETEKPLSQLMRESWEKRTWILSHAFWKSWAFDFIWWRFLDEKYFGPNETEDHTSRPGILSEPRRKVMETFVERKMEESKSKEIVKWEDDQAAGYLVKLLV